MSIGLPHNEGVEEGHLLVLLLFSCELDASCVIYWIQVLGQPIYTMPLDDFQDIIYIAIRQTVPKKASVEAETSTLI